MIEKLWKRVGLPLALCVLNGVLPLVAIADAERPNIILMMADDLGWGDVGFNGNTVIRTPGLDAFARAGINLTHSYSGAPVCSPTRGTFLTGRHHHRYGIYSANKAHLPPQEITVTELLKGRGYRTGHFGKWHLGTLSRTSSAKGPKRQPEINYSPPSWHGYDESFVMESAVATWDPGKGGRSSNNPFYHNGEIVTDNLEGGSSRVIMDRAIPFIEKAHRNGEPFCAIIWFNAPHAEVVAGPEYLAMYPTHGEQAHYYGCITEMDEQVQRLQDTLKELGIYEETFQIFTSDNGPEGRELVEGSNSRFAGSTGGFSGRKRDVFDGGVRVPTAVVWPERLPAGESMDFAASTLDYLPTVAGLLEIPLPDRPIDGEDLLPLLEGERADRSKPIPFLFNRVAGVVSGDFKFLTSSTTDSSQDVLFNLREDKSEIVNCADRHPERAASLRKLTLEYIRSFEASHHGADYDDPTFSPVVPFVSISAREAKVVEPINNVSMRK